MGYKQYKYIPRKGKSTTRRVKIGRTSAKLRATKKRNVVINTGPSLIPDVYITKMKYNTTIRTKNQMNLQQGVPSFVETRYYKISGNSVYDPDDSILTNGWPVGYSEMRHFYEKFYVSSSKIEVRMIAHGGTVEDGFKFAILPSNRDNPNNINMDSLIANPYCTKAKYFGPALGKNIITVRHGMSTQSITGRKKPSLEDDYHGSMNLNLIDGDPLKQWWYILLLQGVNDSLPDTFDMNITVTYNVMFYQRRQQVQDDLDTVKDPIGALDENPPPQPPGPPDNPGGPLA